jgi:uncharacterized protein YqgC (DUF456 family)
MDMLFDIVLIASMTVAVFSNFYGWPGNIVIPVNSLVYGIVTNFQTVTLSFIALLVLLFIIFELLEFVILFFTAKKVGASKWAIMGGVFGGVLGAISGAFFTPVIGAIIGSVLGVFIGAVLLEFIKCKCFGKSLKSGIGVFLGKIGGLSIKVIGAVTMTTMVASKII